MPDRTRALEYDLDNFPEDVFVTLDGFVEWLAAAGPDNPLADFQMHLIQGQLEQLRFRRDRGYEDASRLIEKFQRTIAELALDGRVGGPALAMLVAALHQAGIAASAELSDAMAQQTAEFLSESTPDDLVGSLEEIVKGCDNDPFLVASMLAETGHAMPVEARALMPSVQSQSDSAAMREAAVLSLLDPEPTVRRAAAAALQEGVGRLSADSLRRLIAMRNWCPESERPAVDAIVRAARARQIECAPWPAGKAAAILASCIDGSGAQGSLIVSPAGKRQRLSPVLSKNGIREAWMSPPASRREIRSILDQAAAETSTIPVSREYFDRVVQHHLYVGLAHNALPPAGLLQVAEAIGGAQWQPELLDWRQMLAALVADLPAAMREPHAVETVLRTSAAWARFSAIADSWFEDDQEVARLVGRPSGRAQGKMRDYVLQTVLERRREKWAEHFLWTALWLRETPERDAAPWRNLAILAQALADGRDLSEMSLMRDIAARTVAVMVADSL
jgi:hypothetical protein